MAFDHGAAPIVRPSVAQRSEHALQASGLISRAAHQPEFNRIDFHGFAAVEIAAAIDKPANRRAAAVGRQLKAAGRDGFRLPRQRDVNKALTTGAS